MERYTQKHNYNALLKFGQSYVLMEKVPNSIKHSSSPRKLTMVMVAKVKRLSTLKTKFSVNF